MAKRHADRVGDWESLFLRMEELVLANSGQDEFEEIYKLVIAKLWDERCGKPNRFKSCGSEAETFQAIGALLSEAESAWPGVLERSSTSLLTPNHLDVCVQALARHKICDAGVSVMDSFFEFLVARGAKGAKGQFFTPRYVVEFCVRMLQPRATESVLDPACGSGGFLIHTLNHWVQNDSLGTAAAVKECSSSRLWGFDVDARALRVAKALMVLAGGDAANLIQLNSLLKPETAGPSLFESDPEAGSVLTIEDVCRSRMRHHKGFDVILTNPPFAGDVQEKHVLNAYHVSHGKSRFERDVLFLERCIELLRPGGRMAIVLPHNKFAMGAYAHVRQWVLRNARVLAVVGLGRHTFLPHTHQKASILFAQKNRERSHTPKSDRIFFAVSERDGKNSKGQLVNRPGMNISDSLWERVDQDLAEIVTGFQEFCGTESLVFRG